MGGRVAGIPLLGCTRAVWEWFLWLYATVLQTDRCLHAHRMVHLLCMPVVSEGLVPCSGLHPGPVARACWARATICLPCSRRTLYFAHQAASELLLPPATPAVELWLLLQDGVLLPCCPTVIPLLPNCMQGAALVLCFWHCSLTRGCSSRQQQPCHLWAAECTLHGHDACRLRHRQGYQLV